jgi:hypothetical protein
MNNGIIKLQDPEWWQRQCLSDLYFFCRTMLITLEDTSPGFKDLYYPTHKRICDFVQHYAYEGQKLLVLTPRHWIKSYIITLGWYTQRLLRNLLDNRREIGIISNATYPNAQEFLRRIKFNLEYNDLLNFFFSEHLPKDFATGSTEWTKDCIEINGNRIELGSVEKNLVSRHYFIMINDDLVNRDNSLTAQGLVGVHDWWGLAHSLLHPQGIEINIGTRWSIDDNYGQIMSKFCPMPSEDVYDQPIAEWHNGNYHVLHINCWEDPKTESGSTFPYLFPEEKLHELKLQLGDRFYGQYENNPMNTGKNPFKWNWIRRFTPNIVPSVRNTLMLIDCSGKAKKDESSATGITIMQLCSDKCIYVEHGKRYMITDRNLAEKIIELAMIYRPDEIGAEDVKFQSLVDLVELVVAEQLRHLMVNKEDAEYMKLIPRIMIELKPRGRPKVVRITQLTGFFESGKILLPFSGAEDLEDEYKKYPSVKDDVLDSLAYVLDVGVFPRPTDPPKIFELTKQEKQTTEERIQEEWDKIREEAWVGATYPEGFGPGWE